MKPEDIDRLLATQDSITPSSGFLASVMDAVERDARMLPPLRFPWSRALPGLLATGVAIVGVIGYGAGLWGAPTATSFADESVARLVAVVGGLELQWIGLACAATLLPLALASGLTRGRGYG